MFLSMVSLINEYIEVYDVSMKDKHTEFSPSEHRPPEYLP